MASSIVIDLSGLASKEASLFAKEKEKDVASLWTLPVNREKCAIFHIQPDPNYPHCDNFRCFLDSDYASYELYWT